MEIDEAIDSLYKEGTNTPMPSEKLEQEAYLSRNGLTSEEYLNKREGEEQALWDNLNNPPVYPWTKQLATGFVNDVSAKYSLFRIAGKGLDISSNFLTQKVIPSHPDPSSIAANIGLTSQGYIDKYLEEAQTWSSGNNDSMIDVNSYSYKAGQLVGEGAQYAAGGFKLLSLSSRIATPVVEKLAGQAALLGANASLDLFSKFMIKGAAAGGALAIYDVIRETMAGVVGLDKYKHPLESLEHIAAYALIGSGIGVGAAGVTVALPTLFKIGEKVYSAAFKPIDDFLRKHGWGKPREEPTAEVPPEPETEPATKPETKEYKKLEVVPKPQPKQQPRMEWTPKLEHKPEQPPPLSSEPLLATPIEETPTHIASRGGQIIEKGGNIQALSLKDNLDAVLHAAETMTGADLPNVVSFWRTRIAKKFNKIPAQEREEISKYRGNLLKALKTQKLERAKLINEISNLSEDELRRVPAYDLAKLHGIIRETEWNPELYATTPGLTKMNQMIKKVMPKVGLYNTLPTSLKHQVSSLSPKQRDIIDQHTFHGSTPVNEIKYLEKYLEKKPHNLTKQNQALLEQRLSSLRQHKPNQVHVPSVLARWLHETDDDIATMTGTYADLEHINSRSFTKMWSADRDAYRAIIDNYLPPTTLDPIAAMDERTMSQGERIERSQGEQPPMTEEIEEEGIKDGDLQALTESEREDALSHLDALEKLESKDRHIRELGRKLINCMTAIPTGVK